MTVRSSNDAASIRKRVWALVDPVVVHSGYELVDVRFVMEPGGWVLRVFIDLPAPDPGNEPQDVDLDDCERISRELSALLDVEDPIAQAYSLEVSSPGIDRPLTRLKDYKDWTGHEARIKLREPHEGRKQFSCTIQGIEGEEVLIITREGEAHALRFSDIASAKLVLTDKLIQATAPLSTEGADHIETVEE